MCAYIHIYIHSSEITQEKYEESGQFPEGIKNTATDLDFRKCWGHHINLSCYHHFFQ